MPATTPPEPHTSELLLDRFMSTYDLAVVHCGVFRVSPRECHEAVLSFDAFDSRLIRMLIGARGMPEQVLHRSQRTGKDRTFRIRDLTQRGWLLLGETPGVETVLGSISQPWRAGGAAPRRPVPPEDFAGFQEPGFAKIAISFRVDAYGSSASIMTVETRILLTDPDSRRRFLRYWLVVGPFSHLIRRQALRMLSRRLNPPPLS